MSGPLSSHIQHVPAAIWYTNFTQPLVLSRNETDHTLRLLRPGDSLLYVKLVEWDSAISTGSPEGSRCYYYTWFDPSTGMVKKAGPRSCALMLLLSVAAMASSHKQGPIFLTISVHQSARLSKNSAKVAWVSRTCIVAQPLSDMLLNSVFTPPHQTKINTRSPV